jgi:hypothetical protein
VQSGYTLDFTLSTKAWSAAMLSRQLLKLIPAKRILPRPANVKDKRLVAANDEQGAISPTAIRLEKELPDWLGVVVALWRLSQRFGPLAQRTKRLHPRVVPCLRTSRGALFDPRQDGANVILGGVGEADAYAHELGRLNSWRMTFIASATS